MSDLAQHTDQFTREGFAVIEAIYSAEEVNAIAESIEFANSTNPTFRKSDDLFAIRQFLKEIPAINSLLFTDSLKSIVKQFFGDKYFVVKSIYFDKPERSNWFVAYHQDLTISVDNKADLPGYSSWTKKHGQFAVQPPLNILEDNFTIRIHLDDVDSDNGALKVIPGSHQKGIYRPETIDWSTEREAICNVKQGGIMFMRPLTLHASERTTNNKRRRVIHIEFSRSNLPAEINWSELDFINFN